MTPAETVTAFIAAIEHKDIDAALALAATDISYENMPFSPIVGHEGVAQTLGAFLAPASEVDWQILTQYEVGTTVFNERLDRFRIGDGWIELPIAGVFHIDDNGMIAVWRDYFDMATYERQLTELTKSP